MQLLSHDVIQAAFTERGYKLLSTYQGNKYKLEYICPNNHQSSIFWNHFKKGIGCGFCAKRKQSKDVIKAAFEQEGYTLLEDFTRSDKPIKFICPKGHHHQITWNSFRAGCRCYQCSVNFPLTHQEVKRAFEQEGYTLLDKYQSVSTKMRFICPNGHKHSIAWAHFKKGHRCGYCSGSLVTHEIVKKAFEDAGYQLLSTYERHNYKLNFICPNGHEHHISWNGFQQGARCARCYGMNKTEEEKQLVKLATSIRSQIRGHLARLQQTQGGEIKLLKSKSAIAHQLARQIYETLGNRPPLHDLDHIVPVSFFNLLNQEEVCACWSLHNLRYLPKEENNKRNNRLTLEEVNAFTEEQLIILRLASRKPLKWNTY